MAKVIVLGGCGAVGSVAVTTMAKQDIFSEVVIGDLNLDKVEQIINSLTSNAQAAKKISAISVDASDQVSIRSAIQGCDLVVNCVGPFYKTVKTVLATVIEAGINYVDVCDDVDVTLEILEWTDKAKAAGITALIGMGSSPGVTNILAKFAANVLIEKIDSVDIFHAHGGEPIEGAGVIGHRFHCMSIEIPMYLEGQLKYVNYFEKEGVALRQQFDFPVLGKNIPLYPYPHPEQVTLPKYLSLNQVTNKGTVLPNEYYDLTRDMCQLGLASKAPIEVNGQSITPYDFAVAYIIKQREKILRETGFGQQRGCVSVVVKGTTAGQYDEYRFHLASQSQALGEGTGIPAAMGAILMQRGDIVEKGVMPPEACVDPLKFIELMPSVIKLDKQKEGGESFGGVIVQRVDAQGNIQTLDI